jgi:ABC-type nitrate/sulfonate/bicarbonate transport system substrate-binding protein
MIQTENENLRHIIRELRTELEANKETIKKLEKQLQEAQDTIDTHSELIDYLADLLAEITGDPVFEDERVDYMEVQISRKLWEEAQKFKSMTKEKKGR